MDVNFEGVSGGNERSLGRIVGESFQQGIVAGHDLLSQQIWHIERACNGAGCRFLEDISYLLITHAMSRGHETFRFFH